jgi:preprotein translocase subunit SecF
VLAITISITFLFIKGLNYGVDFKGGTLLEIRISDSNIKIQDIRSSLRTANLGDVSVKRFGQEGDFLVKFEKNSNKNKKFISELKTYISGKIGSDINFRRVESVGPKVSSELLKQGITAIALSLVAMLFYIWVRFEWQFSLGSIIALFHDVIITLGIFSILSLEVNLSIVAAVLTIVGYSMNDTVVIYDRIRENLLKYSKINTNEIANISVNETLSRTVITSLTTLLALGSIFILGGEILKGFSFAMILGVIIGTYSSIFVASPVLNYFKVTQKTLLKDDVV